MVQCGLAVSDLFRIYTKGQHISDKNKLQADKDIYLDLVKGIAQHFKADEIFHNWDWFKEKNHELALKIRESKLEIKRDWFLAHIFIELAIDHVLVCKNELKVKELYFDLMACDKPEWELFFTRNTLEKFDTWYEGYEKFNKHQYIFTYKDTGNVIYALNRIYMNTGIGEFDVSQNRFLELLLNSFIPEVKLKIGELNKIIE